GDGNHPNLNHPTIVDLIENTGHTWKAFGEDASGTGCGLNPPRGEDHFPFLSYTTITGSPSRCANLLPGSGNEVINAFNAGTNFIWLTPNDCNNMQSCSVATGDNYIHGWVPQLVTSMIRIRHSSDPNGTYIGHWRIRGCFRQLAGGWRLHRHCRTHRIVITRGRNDVLRTSVHQCQRDVLVHRQRR